MKDIMNMMKQAQELQAKVQEFQAELEAMQVEGVSGGGLVKVTLSGKGAMVRVSIDPEPDETQRHGNYRNI